MKAPSPDMADSHSDFHSRSWLGGIPALAKASHPYLAMLIAAASLCTVISFPVNGVYTIPQALISSIHIVLLMCMYRHPVPCGCAITMLSIVTVAIPDTEFVIQLWSLWLAMGILGYERRLRIALTLIGLQAVVITIGMKEHPQSPNWNYSGVLSFSIVCLIIAVIGYALAEHQTAERLRHEARERQRLEDEQRRLHRDMVLASRIHDSTTRGLALISLLAEQCGQEAVGDGLTERIRLIGSTARSTLRDVRTVIDVLNGEEPGDSSEGHRAEDAGQSSPQPMGLMLRRLLDDNDARMSSIGIHGESVVESPSGIAAPAIAPEMLQEITDLINQMYTNIAVHGEHGMDTYHIRVELTDTALHIREFNSIGHADDDLHMGRGLSMHAKRVRNLGGDITMSSEDGIWSMSARLPLAAPRNDGRHSPSSNG